MPDDLMGKIQEILSDEESMKQLNDLAQMFSSPENSKQTQPGNAASDNNSQKPGDMSGSLGLGDFDFTKILKVQEIMSKASNDKSADFLLALKPLLREERRERVDRAVKMIKLFAVWTVLKDSGLLNDFI